MSAKAFTARPPGVDPMWWASASWAAKQKARRARLAGVRPDDSHEDRAYASAIEPKPALVKPVRVITVKKSLTAGDVAEIYGDTKRLGKYRLAMAYAEAYGLPEPPEPVRRSTWSDRAKLVDELLNGHGCSAEAVAAYFGVGIGALEKAMRRAGRPDLARPFAKLHSQQRRAAA